MHLLLTTTTNLAVMVFSSDSERSQTVLPWQSEKLPFVQHAASVSMGPTLPFVQLAHPLGLEPQAPTRRKH